MRLPGAIRKPRQVLRTLRAFPGIDRRPGSPDGACTALENMMTDGWPALAARPPLGPALHTGVTDLFGWDKPILIRGQALYYGDRMIGQVSAGRHSFAALNRKLVIWPDRVYLDADDLQLHQLEQTAQLTGFTLASNGIGYTNTPPTVLDNIVYRFRPGELPLELRVYAQKPLHITEAGWPQEGAVRKPLAALQPGEYFLLHSWEEERRYRPELYHVGKSGGREDPSACGRVISADKTDGILTFAVLDPAQRDLETRFAPGDVVTIRLSNAAGVFSQISAAKISSCTAAGITFTAPVLEEVWQKPAAACTILRQVPALDAICACENRIWGVSNGDRTIYACALGDPTNWYDYAGLATDAYASPAASPEDFTGIAALGGEVLAMKPREILRFSGSYPAAYAMYTHSVPGLASGCGPGAADRDELYYLAEDGIYAFHSGSPVCVSRALGSLKGHSGGRLWIQGRSLHCCLQQGAGSWVNYAMDLENGLWTGGEPGMILARIRTDGCDWLLNGDGTVRAAPGGEGSAEFKISFVPWTEDTAVFKHYRMLRLGVEADTGNRLIAVWGEAGAAVTQRWSAVLRNGPQTLLIPMDCRVRALQLTLQGTGPFRLLWLEREYDEGSLY